MQRSCGHALLFDNLCPLQTLMQKQLLRIKRLLKEESWSRKDDDGVGKICSDDVRYTSANGTH